LNRKLSTREKVLLAFLAVAAVIFYRAWSGKGIGFGGESPAPAVETRDLGEPPHVRTDLLARNTVEFDPSGRNLFDYYTPPRQPKPKPKPEPRPKPPPPKRESAVRPPPPPPPLFDGDDGVVLRRPGDKVDEQFVLLNFKYEAVTLGYTDTKWRDRTTELKLFGLRGES
jgi:hypothetical protein